ncbi:hypothetical protein [Vibrio cholerae]|uniref:hypothetical protein n=1 Tax=Vibrio cholerae TaxID=666 RepID=UPI00166CB8AB|nr:hypothetical protein [Vibrio cholerae]GFK55884.1 Transcriptional regulator VspR [Vibrio cholerae]GFK59427.1 Transcriptional regulator VspR [Vibrio cholerae]GFK62972.1 Transcriptional regulator VspR [Vibrio cholerae]GFK67169.1 Transcriptional regulator VspR [Vibrio cholerae]GFK70065.1 Transcriptional regulator VspR [Vibrio cholerae]
MSHSQKINAFMHNLLIENEMDNFSLVEIKDALLDIEEFASTGQDAHKFVYRQVWGLEKKGWLNSDGIGREKRYMQTDLFKGLNLVSRPMPVKVNQVSDAPRAQQDKYNILINERNECEGELEIILGEIEEYRSLNQRFPELSLQITPLLKNARERSALLLGKINVLTNVLNSLNENGY